MTGGRVNRSTLSAAMVYYSGYLCGALLAKTERVAALELAWLCLAACAITAGCGPGLVRGRHR